MLSLRPDDQAAGRTQPRSGGGGRRLRRLSLSMVRVRSQARSRLQHGHCQEDGPRERQQGGGADGREGDGGPGGDERRARRSRRGEGLEELHLEARGVKKQIEMP